MLHTEPMQKVRIVSLDGDKARVVAALHMMGAIDLRKSKLQLGDDKPATLRKIFEANHKPESWGGLATTPWYLASERD